MKNWNLAQIGLKVTALACGLGMLFTTANAQGIPSSSVPANTLKAFQASSGGAAATWMAGPNKSYEAAFQKEGQKMVYVYDDAGVLQQKKIVSSVSAMPAGVGAALTASYPKGNVEYAYKVVNRTNQKYYEVQMGNAGGAERVRFDLEGKSIGKTSLAGVQPAGSQPVASAQPATKPVTQPSPVKPATPAPTATKPATTSQPVAMRGEAATTAKTTKAMDDEMDDDLGDLMDDDDLGDLMDGEDENWDDIDLGDDMDDDSDLLDGTDDLDDDLDLDEDLDDDGDDL
ncbi:MAG: hypothetical protein U0176_13360 [Bacteroidia bacterium]